MAVNPRAKKGDNTKPPLAADRLRSIVERIERLTEEKKALSDDIKDVYAEAKGAGFDTKAIRGVISKRKQDADVWTEYQTLLGVYLRALGEDAADL